MTAVRLAAFVLAVAVAAPASAASLLEKNFWLSGPNYDGVLPSCRDSYVVTKIAQKFASRESTYWNSSLTLLSFDRAREIAFRPWGPSYIPRRFCSARVLVSDQRYRTVYYAIGEDLNFASMIGASGGSWGVEWCVSGLDRNLAFAPDCKMAQP